MARDNGGIIGPANNPTSDSASGVWDLPAQYQAISGGNWPPIPSIAANSLRFDDGSSDYLNRTQSSGNRKTFTISCWLKRSNLGGGKIITGINDGVAPYARIFFDTNDVLKIEDDNGSTVTNIVTNRLFRDVSAWYHLVIAYDTTQATASDRVKMYVNGVQETSFSSSTYPSQNFDTEYNKASVAINIGKFSSSYLDGYLSEVILVDGQQLDPTSFGQFNANGIWTPIPIGISSFGTNGFRLKFENSASLGLDSSPNGNNFTVNNLTSIDQSTDIPTNNFATLNPLNQGRDAGTGIFTEGNLEFESTQTGGNYPRGISSIGIDSGKWYMEMKVLNSQNVNIGISNGDSYNELYADFTDDIGYDSATGNVYIEGAGSAYGNTFTTNDIIGIAMDLDNHKLYFSKNGTFQNGGVPTSGATGTGAISINNPSQTGFYFFTVGDSSSAGTPNVACNFGSPPFTIASSNSDADGYGNFEYTVPSGYYALNTKNLAEFG
jgi:hypothetical protein